MEQVLLQCQDLLEHHPPTQKGCTQLWDWTSAVSQSRVCALHHHELMTHSLLAHPEQLLCHNVMGAVLMTPRVRNRAREAGLAPAAVPPRLQLGAQLEGLLFPGQRCPMHHEGRGPQSIVRRAA